MKDKTIKVLKSQPSTASEVSNRAQRHKKYEGRNAYVKKFHFKKGRIIRNKFIVFEIF